MFTYEENEIVASTKTENGICISAVSCRQRLYTVKRSVYQTVSVYC